jgi:hypothetical protein
MLASAALRENLQAELTASLAEIPDGGAEQHGIRLGHDIAQSILAQRAGDGWNAVVDPQTEIGTDPGEWRPTPTGFANPLAPHWGDVTPWAIESAQQFIPEAPPTLTSNEYAAAYNETKQLGAANSEQLGLRTADQTQIALFWADGAGTHTPPGHWNKIAGEVAQVEGRLCVGSRAIARRPRCLFAVNAGGKRRWTCSRAKHRRRIRARRQIWKKSWREPCNSNTQRKQGFGFLASANYFNNLGYQRHAKRAI